MWVEASYPMNGPAPDTVRDARPIREVHRLDGCPLGGTLVDRRQPAGPGPRVIPGRQQRTGEGHDGEASPVTGPEAITYADIAAALSRELGRDVEHV